MKLSQDEKPQAPLPLTARRILRRILPRSCYDRYFGRHDNGSKNIWKLLAAQAPSQFSILDIGAFIGDYARAARSANSAASIHAFEPDPRNLERLQSRCADLRITVHHHAVSNESGTAQFTGNVQMGTLDSPGTVSPNASVSDQVSLQVERTTLDSFHQKYSEPIFLAKIDTEGHESEVLQGAQHVLKECDPILLCEVLTDQAGEALQTTLPEAYVYWEIDENRGVRPQHAIRRNSWRNLNWLLVPRNRAEEIARLLESNHLTAASLRNEL